MTECEEECECCGDIIDYDDWFWEDEYHLCLICLSNAQMYIGGS